MLLQKTTMVRYVLSVMFGCALGCSLTVHAADDQEVPAASAADQVWRLPAHPPFPVDNKPTADRVNLGQQLFFDPRLSGSKNTSCATCHNPSLGWSDGRSTASGVKEQVLGRATPSVENLAFNTIFMWDGRKPTLEAQALGPMEASVEMNSNFSDMITFLKNNKGYKTSFEQAYPGQEISKDTLGKAIASFERTLTVEDTPFDRWLAGDKTALTSSEWRGFQVFKKQGNCASCHAAPNFTDNGFHNLGLAQKGTQAADLGRFAIRKVAVNKGAFKTPPLRNVQYTAPYFHDGSAQTLEQVVEHYVRGGDVKDNLSPDMHPLNLTEENKTDLLMLRTIDSAKLLG